MDNITERNVIESIRKLPEKKTIIFIAHRLSTIQNADKIFEIENGEVKALGSFDELKAKSETFRELAREIYK